MAFKHQETPTENLLIQKPAISRLLLQWLETMALDPEAHDEFHIRWPNGLSWKNFYRILLDLKNARLSRLSASDRQLDTSGTASAAEMEVSEVMSGADGFTSSEERQLKESFSSLNSKGRDVSVVNGVTGIEICEEVSGAGSKELVGNGFSVLGDYTERVSLVADLEENGGKCLDGIDDSELKLMKGLREKDFGGAVNTVEKLVLDLQENCEENAYLYLDLQQSGENAINDTRIEENSVDTVHTNSDSIEKGKKSSVGFGVSGNSKQENVGKENNHARKVHQELAYIEGEFKSIATDINQTKETLDIKDMDASKLILLNKILEIEKPMGRIMDYGEISLGSGAVVETDELKDAHLENNPDALAGSTRNSITSTDNGDSKDGLSPHHEIVGNCASFGNSERKDESLKSNILEMFGDSVQEEGSLNRLDENFISLKFLALSDKKCFEVKDKQGQLECAAVQEMDADRTQEPEVVQASKEAVRGMDDEDVKLTADENLDHLDDQGTRPSKKLKEDTKESSSNLVKEIGRKSSTSGWFVSKGESVLLAHDDSTCSFFDIANLEEKSVYNPPVGVSANLWGDCWLIDAPDSAGHTARFVVAASAGSTSEAGFCSWDFYRKDIRAFRVENSTAPRQAVCPLSTRATDKEPMEDISFSNAAPGDQQWWYKPSGPLIASAACYQKVVSIYDIRDGDQIMRWEAPKPILAMDYSSPLQWRSNGQVVIAETEGMTIWDVNETYPRAFISIASRGKRVSALHVNNANAELQAGVRRRLISSVADGVFCTQDSVNVLDFRLPTGVGLKISNYGFNSQSISYHRDSIFVGCTPAKSDPRKISRSRVQQFSLNKGKIFATYVLPQSTAHSHNSSVTQVWGDENLVMAVCGRGLFVFDTFRYDAQPVSIIRSHPRQPREVIGPDDLCRPSFDFLGSQVLLISRDRPALLKYFL